MFKNNLISYFKTQQDIAEYFNIKQSAIAHWKNIIPEKRARQLAMDMPDKFKFDSSLYQKKAS